MNDRQRVEALLLPQMLLAVLLAGVNDPNAPEAVEAANLLNAAQGEPLRGLVPERAEKLVRRVCRLHLEITAPYRTDGARMDKLGAAVLYMLQRILDADYLVLYEGSNMQRALDLMVPALAHVFDVERLDASAQKAGRRMLEHAQRLGYFEGVPTEIRTNAAA